MSRYGLNQVTLIGRLGSDPDYKMLDQGYGLTRLSMACTTPYRDHQTGQMVEKTVWVPVTLWRGQAEVAAQYCRKGSLVCVEGRLTSHSWETPQGEKRSRMEVEGTRFVLLESRPADATSETPDFLSQPVAPYDISDDDELPF
jgi:single-strand DNA-binding protein